MVDELERTRKKSVVVYSRYYPDIFLDALRKVKEIQFVTASPTGSVLECKSIRCANLSVRIEETDGNKAPCKLAPDLPVDLPRDSRHLPGLCHLSTCSIF